MQLNPGVRRALSRSRTLEERIYPAELLLLGAFLAGPVLALAAASQAAFLSRHIFAGQKVRLIAWVSATLLLVYLLTFVVWIGVPQKYLWWWGTKGPWPFMVFGVAFVPAVVAALVAVPGMSWAAHVASRHRATRGNGQRPQGAHVPPPEDERSPQ